MRTARIAFRTGTASSFRLGLLASVAFAALTLAGPAEVAHADTIETSDQRETSEDPASITFSVRVNAPAGLESATLIYSVLNPDGNVGGSGRGTFTPGAETDITYTLETSTAQRYIPVGSRIAYHWEIQDRDGDELKTPPHEFTFLDGRYTWQSRSDNGVTVFWYGDNEDRATSTLAAARESLDTTSALLEVEVPYDVRVVVYASEADGQLAQQPRGGTFDEQVITGGQRVAPDLLLVYTPDSDVVRHEVGHIVTHVAGDGAFTSLPSWLDEGVAVYVQSSPGGGYSTALDFALVTGDTLSLRSMQSPTNRPEYINLFYGQSFSTVEFLIEEYGQPQFADLFRAHFEGAPIDRALMEVYGFDQHGLYNAWRVSKGLEPVEAGAAPNAPAAPGAEATRPPIGVPAPGGAAAPAAPGLDSGGTVGTDQRADDAASGVPGRAIVVALATLLVAGGLGGGALLLLRSGKQS